MIQKSSNVGAAKIALSLPSSTMWQMLSDTGFGAAPNTGFPGEVAGRLRPAKTWKPIEQATMAYGHGISVNLVQLARAYTVFASEGQLKPATLFKAGSSVAGRPVMKAETALAVRRMLELAVLPGGTAPKAQVAGYRVAGKTGTAHKLAGRGYTNKYVSSFVGFAPASAPRLIVAVMIDEPTAGAHYGGEVAAPVFSTVMGSALRTLGVPPDAPGDNVILPDATADPGGDMSGAMLASDLDVAALLARLAVIPRRITADSRLVRAGDAFAAFPGQETDGRAFIPDAIARGAGAVLWEALAFHWDAAWRVSNVAVEGLKTKLGVIADHIYGNPSRELFVVGVTGTNGKTSCTHWIAQCLDACGTEERDHGHARQRHLGTLGRGLVGALDPSTRTTPDAAAVHETLARLKSEGARAVAMEVSSHGLDQGRVNGVEFDVALFTNLTRDHLDYHGTMADYGAAKVQLFAWPTLEACVINTDDPFGRTLASEARARKQNVLTYGLADADIVAMRVEPTQAGMALSIATPWGRGEIAPRVSGTFNASNALGVLGVLLSSGIGFEAGARRARARDAAGGTNAADRRRAAAARRGRLRAHARRIGEGARRACGPRSPKAASSSACSDAAAIAIRANARKWGASPPSAPTGSS